MRRNLQTIFKTWSLLRVFDNSNIKRCICTEIIFLFANHSNASFLWASPPRQQGPRTRPSHLKRPRNISCLPINGKEELAVLKIINNTSANSSKQQLHAKLLSQLLRNAEQNVKQPSEMHWGKKKGIKTGKKNNHPCHQNKIRVGARFPLSLLTNPSIKFVCVVNVSEVSMSVLNISGRGTSRQDVPDAFFCCCLWSGWREAGSSAAP